MVNGDGQQVENVVVIQQTTETITLPASDDGSGDAATIIKTTTLIAETSGITVVDVEPGTDSSFYGAGDLSSDTIIDYDS